MSSRRPAKHPFAEIYTQGRWVPALVMAWVHGGGGDPEAWSAEVVINSINEPGHAVELVVRASSIRPAALGEVRTD